MSQAPLPNTVSGDVPMPSSFDDDPEFWEEGRWKKLNRKLRQEPLIPFGLALTCYALYGATKAMRRGDRELTNMYFRARVYAQAFTLVCVCGGALYWKEDREKRKYYKGLLAEKRAQEKREAWIKELEAREAEAEVERQKRAALKKQAGLAPVASAQQADVGTAKKKEKLTEKTAALENGKKKEAVEKERNTNSSPLENAQLRDVAVGSQLLSQAMWLWKRSSSTNTNDDVD